MTAAVRAGTPKAGYWTRRGVMYVGAAASSSSA